MGRRNKDAPVSSLETTVGEKIEWPDGQTDITQAVISAITTSPANLADCADRSEVVTAITELKDKLNEVITLINTFNS